MGFGFPRVFGRRHVFPFHEVVHVAIELLVIQNVFDLMFFLPVYEFWCCFEVVLSMLFGLVVWSE